MVSTVDSKEFKAWAAMWKSRHPQDICAEHEKLLYEFSAERALLESGYCDASQSWPLLYGAVRWLAGYRDGEVKLDFQLLSKRDTRGGQRLASCRWWTPKMANEIYLRLRKYRKQLAQAGIDYKTIPKPECIV